MPFKTAGLRACLLHKLHRPWCPTRFGRKMPGGVAWSQRPCGEVVTRNLGLTEFLFLVTINSTPPGGVFWLNTPKGVLRIEHTPQKTGGCFGISTYLRPTGVYVNYKTPPTILRLEGVFESGNTPWLRVHLCFQVGGVFNFEHSPLVFT